MTSATTLPNASESVSDDIQDVPTPALIVDAAVVRRNIERLASYAASHELGIRPHTKTHKSRMLGRLQVEAGAIGLTVAKAGEAEHMMHASDDLLMAYPAVDPARCKRLAELAAAKTVRVAIDSARAVQTLATAASEAGSTLGLLVDIDVGLGRTGVATPAEALALAQTIARTQGVRLDGIFCYPGHIGTPAAEQGPQLAAVAEKLQETIDLWRAQGLEARIVSGGSTPTAYQSHLVKPYTEIRPGTYIFNDMNIVHGGYCALEDCAARIVCTVVSDAVKNQVVIDGGSKTLSSDLCGPAPSSGHGYVLEYPRARVCKLSEEHAQVDVSCCEERPRVGERITVIPNHICPCINLQDSFWWVDGGKLIKVAVDARGKLS